MKLLVIQFIVNRFLLISAGPFDPHCNIPICKTRHILCKFQGVNQRDRCFYKGWITNSKLDINEQDMILHIHNKVRSDVALGRRLCGNKLQLRSASKMYSLVYDGQLSFMAELWVSQCLEHNDACLHVDRFRVGMNTVLHFVSNRSHMDALYDMLQLWINECMFFKPRYVTSFESLYYSPRIALVGNFTQIIWANTSSIGCAKAIFHNAPEGIDNHSDSLERKYTYWLICLYGPECCSGPKMYDIGTTCSECPLDDNCMNGLCIAKESRCTIHIPDCTLILGFVAGILWL